MFGGSNFMSATNSSKRRDIRMTASLTPMSTQTVLKVSHLASTQSLGDGAVIVLTDSGQLYTCNDTAETLLKLVDGRPPCALASCRRLPEVPLREICVRPIGLVLY